MQNAKLRKLKHQKNEYHEKITPHRRTLHSALRTLHCAGPGHADDDSRVDEPSGLVAGNTTSNLFGTNGLPAGNIINLRQGQGMATAMTYNGTNAATTLGFSLNWSVSLDGTNWQTVGFLQNSNAANGTNSCTIWTNYASAALNNALFITPYSIQNANAATNGITLSNVTVSFGNLVPGGYP